MDGGQHVDSILKVRLKYCQDVDIFPHPYAFSNYVYKNGAVLSCRHQAKLYYDSLVSIIIMQIAQMSACF